MPNPTDQGPQPIRYQSRESGYGLRFGRLRGAFTRENASLVVRRLAWVAPMTLLIWIYAERQQERHQTVRFPVELVLNSPDRVILGPSDRFITADLRGPAAQLEMIKTQLLQSADPSTDKPAVTLPLDQSWAPGSHEVRTAQIATDVMFRSHAITIENTEPQTLSVYVDQVIDREVAIRVPPNVTNLDGNPVFDPPRVRVRGPRLEIERVASDGMLDAFADLAGRESLKTPGVHDERAVPIITQLRGEHVSVTPAKVNVTLKVRQADVTFKWPYMPIWVNTPPGFGDKYKVILTNQTLKDVHLTGPAETIAAMQQDSYKPKPKARLDVSNADLPPGETRVKVVQFDDLPKGVAVSAEDVTRPAEFKVVDATKE